METQHTPTASTPGGFPAPILFIVVAAGRGSRFGSDVPKQFCLLDGMPVVLHAVQAMRRCAPGAEVAVVLPADAVDGWPALCRRHGVEPTPAVAGGSSRFGSVKAAVDAFGAGRRLIAVHDGARPVISRSLIDGIMEACIDGAEAVVPVVPVTDSLRRRLPDGASEAVDRSRYAVVQTPQMFDAELLVRAYSQPESPLFTDDASVVEAAGARVTLAEGDVRNIKITHPSDIDIARIYLTGL